jgi:hypothetical protein
MALADFGGGSGWLWRWLWLEEWMVRKMEKKFLGLA